MELGKYADGRSVSYDESAGTFKVGDSQVSVQDVRAWDGAGQIAWASPQQRGWFHSTFSAAGSVPAAPAKKKSKLPLILGIVALLLLVTCGGCTVLGSLASKGGSSTAGTSGSSASSTSAPKPAQAPAAAAPAKPQLKKIGEPLKVGSLVFTVDDVASTTKLSSPIGNKDGNFLVVTLTVKNESKEAVLIDSSFLKLIAPDGAKYETDSDTLMYVATDKNFFLQKINPNLSKQGTVIFSVPAGLTGMKLQVQTGAFGTETGEISLAK